jgi:hypothetical protein
VPGIAAAKGQVDEHGEPSVERERQQTFLVSVCMRSKRCYVESFS